MKKFLFDCGTRDVTASIGILSLRLLAGAMMLIGHGIPKIQNFAALKATFPVPHFLDKVLSSPASLVLCICAEAGATALVILGLATRPAAFLVGLCMVFASFGYLDAAPWFQTSPTLVETKELSIMYLIPMIAIILSGAGGYSFDALLHKEDKRRRW
ncbi:DoxX family protein [Luteolibacter yonseiensis]|uniref:DoxX family protein n=1 Tax=Luteolibacter yonseiensis TaxID=1144680 RepID=A0A934R769_9BACT|nr:DoxX family protein [Luteolibacter yonseiensis]MBK1817607.1 DoxX family protein [Luteolibacter yonseiensis]